MAVGPIRIPGAVDPRQAYGPGAAGQAPQSPQTSFASMFEKAVGQVDALQAGRDDMVEGMVSGEVGEVHDVMIAAEEAKLAFDLMLEVRNKLLEAYNEVMRLQI